MLLMLIYVSISLGKIHINLGTFKNTYKYNHFQKLTTCQIYIQILVLWKKNPQSPFIPYQLIPETSS